MRQKLKLTKDFNAGKASSVFDVLWSLSLVLLNHSESWWAYPKLVGDFYLNEFRNLYYGARDDEREPPASSEANSASDTSCSIL